MIFDTHSHYDDEQFDIDRDELLGSFASQGVLTVVTVGANIETSASAISLMEKYSYVYAAVGVHPNEVEELTEADMEWLKTQAKKDKVVAIGEIGLDYYWPEPDHEIQKKWFVRQLALAREVGLPVIIHSRDAAADTLEIMQKENASEIGGVIHCFSYSKEMAKTYVDMGFYIGIGGVVTFKNAKKCKEVVEGIPLTSIVLETDCPYLTPEPFRGKRNDSTKLHYVVEQIAAIKGVSTEEVERVTWENAHKLYNMKGLGE